MTDARTPSTAQRYDFHIHSRHSYDCLMRPQGIIDMARKRGLRGIAVADHDTIAGGVEVRALAPSDLLVIVGAEIYTDVGDIVGLFLHREIQSRDPLEVIRQIHAQGGVAFLPHPLRSHPAIPEAVLNACDGYETLNSRAGWFATTQRGGKSDWAPLQSKAELGCSDAHLYSEIGRGHTLIDGPATEENVARQIRLRRTRAQGEPGPGRNFYYSQLIKLIKTRDASMLTRLGRRAIRRLFQVGRAGGQAGGG